MLIRAVISTVPLTWVSYSKPVKSTDFSYRTAIRLLKARISLNKSSIRKRFRTRCRPIKTPENAIYLPYFSTFVERKRLRTTRFDCVFFIWQLSNSSVGMRSLVKYVSETRIDIIQLRRLWSSNTYNCTQSQLCSFTPIISVYNTQELTGSRKYKIRSILYSSNKESDKEEDTLVSTI